MSSESREGWRTREVAELLSEGSLVIGDGYRAKNSELSSQGLPFARAKNIKNGFDFATADRVPETTLVKVGAKRSEVGDALFTSKGTVGRFAKVKPNTEPFVYSPQVCFWRVTDPATLDPDFVFYWLQGSESTNQMNILKGQTDMADYLSLRDQRAMKMTVPDVSEQRRIAWVLSSLDEKIDLNRQMIQTLLQTSQVIFRERTRDSEWTLPIAEVAHTIDCLHSKKPIAVDEGERQLLQLSNIREDGLVDPTPPYLISESDYSEWIRRIEVRRGDCVITNVGRVGAVGRVPELRAAIGRNMTAVRTKEIWPFPTVLIESLLSERMKIQVNVLTDAGTVMNALNVKNIPHLKVPRMSESELRSLEGVVSPLWTKREVLLAEAQTLEGLRERLLPQIVSGRVRIPADLVTGNSLGISV